MTTNPFKLTWKRGRTAPEGMLAYAGAAVVHGNTAYFTRNKHVYSYTPAKDEWIELPQSDYERFGLAVVNNKVTTVGGLRDGRATNTLHCLEFEGTKWRKTLPEMPRARVDPAAVTTPNYLIVAGGKAEQYGKALPNIEILNTNTLQWFSTISSPAALEYPHMTVCDGHLYLSGHNKIFSCSVEELRKSASTSSSDGSVWTELVNIPVPYWASLTTLRGQVLAIGGSDRLMDGTRTGAIHFYDRSTNSWSAIGEMPTPRYDPLVAVLHSNKLIAVGGWDGKGYCNITEVANSDTLH